MVTEDTIEQTLDERTWCTVLASCLDWAQRLSPFRFRHGRVGRETKVQQTARERQRRLEKHQQDGKAGKPRGGYTSFTGISWIADNSTTLVLVEAKLDTAGNASQQLREYADRIIEELANSEPWRSVEQVDGYLLLLKENGDFISCTLDLQLAVPCGGGQKAAPSLPQSPAQGAVEGLSDGDGGGR
jgi:hypothetical protein